MQSEDYKWFVDNYHDLFIKHGTSYLAIKNKEVIGVYKDLATAVRQTALVHPLGSFIVQRCDGHASAYIVNIASLYFAPVTA